MAETIDDREETRAACIQLMRDIMVSAPLTGLAVGLKVYTCAEVISELQNGTPLGEKMIDMYLLDQERRAQKPPTRLDKLRAGASRLLRQVFGA